MTEAPDQNPAGGQFPDDQPPQDPDRGPQRGRDAAASFASANADAQRGMDAANQSLFDALRITFRLLQAGMVIIAALYVLSGFQSVQSGERGVRTLFGRVLNDDLGPGFRFSLPYPVGELIKVSTTAAPMALDRDFWPDTRGSANDSIESLPNRNELDPGADGSLITADGNIAHARWTVFYSRARPADYLRNVYGPHEERIVRSAVRSGIVAAVSRVTIDDLLKERGGEGEETGTVAENARRIAQDKLDALSTGIVIDRLTLRDKIPPARLRAEFSGVQEADAKAAERTTRAENIARRRLTETAGLAAEPLIELIDQYEAQLALGRTDEAAATLDRINAALEGDADATGGEPVSGMVTRIINAARQDATRIVNARRGEAQIFAAKLEQFRANPLVTISSTWEQAYRAFLARENVQVLLFPEGTAPMEIVLNADPDLVKDLDRARKQAEGEATLRARQRQSEDERFRNIDLNDE